MRHADGYDLLCFLALHDQSPDEDVKCACQKLLDEENEAALEAKRKRNEQGE